MEEKKALIASYPELSDDQIAYVRAGLASMERDWINEGLAAMELAESFKSIFVEEEVRTMKLKDSLEFKNQLIIDSIEHWYNDVILRFQDGWDLITIEDPGDLAWDDGFNIQEEEVLVDSDSCPLCGEYLVDIYDAAPYESKAKCMKCPWALFNAQVNGLYEVIEGQVAILPGTIVRCDAQGQEWQNFIQALNEDAAYAIVNKLWAIGRKEYHKYSPMFEKFSLYDCTPSEYYSYDCWYDEYVLY